MNGKDVVDDLGAVTPGQGLDGGSLSGTTNPFRVTLSTAESGRKQEMRTAVTYVFLKRL